MICCFVSKIGNVICIGGKVYFVKSIALVQEFNFRLSCIFVAKEFNVGEIILTCVVTVEVLLAVGDKDAVYIIIESIVIQVLCVYIAKVGKSGIALVNSSVAVSDNNISLNRCACSLIVGYIHSVPFLAVPSIYIGYSAVLEFYAFVENELIIAYTVFNIIIHILGNICIFRMLLIIDLYNPNYKEYDSNHECYDNDGNTCGQSHSAKYGTTNGDS